MPMLGRFVAFLVNAYALVLLIRFFVDAPYFLFHTSLMPLYKATEPVLSPLRRVVPSARGRDWSALAAMGALYGLLYAGLWAGYQLPAAALAIALLLIVIEFFATAYLFFFLAAYFVREHHGNAIGNFMYLLLSPLREPLLRVVKSPDVANGLGALIVMGAHFLVTYGLYVGAGVLPEYLAASEKALVVGLGSIRLVAHALNAYIIVLIVRIVSSWLSSSRWSPWLSFLDYLTDPVMRPFRRLIPPIGGFDLSPILLFFLLEALHRGFLGLLASMQP